MYWVEIGRPQSRRKSKRDLSAGPSLKRKENANRSANERTNFEVVHVTGIKRTKMCGPKFKRDSIVRGVGGLSTFISYPKLPKHTQFVHPN